MTSPHKEPQVESLRKQFEFWLYELDEVELCDSREKILKLMDTYADAIRDNHASKMVEELEAREKELQDEIGSQGIEFDEHTATRLYEVRRVKDLIKNLSKQV